MTAALLAAAMSTVSGALNSIATLFTYDLYKQWKPQTSEKSLVRIGRIVTFLAMVMAILWSIFGIQGTGTITDILTSINVANEAGKTATRLSTAEDDAPPACSPRGIITTLITTLDNVRTSRAI